MNIHNIILAVWTSAQPLHSLAKKKLKYPIQSTYFLRGLYLHKFNYTSLAIKEIAKMTIVQGILPAVPLTKYTTQSYARTGLLHIRVLNVLLLENGCYTGQFVKAATRDGSTTTLTMIPTVFLQQVSVPACLL